jgi:hypothetical protein
MIARFPLSEANADRLFRARAVLLKLEELWKSRFIQLDAVRANPRHR